MATHRPGVGAWLIGVPIGLALSGAVFADWSISHPERVVELVRNVAGEHDWRIVLADATLDRGDGYFSPSTWRWRIGTVSVINLHPNRPSFLIEGLVVSPPSVSWSGGSLVLTVATASAEEFALHFEEIAKPVTPPPPSGLPLTLVVEHLTVRHFGMTMKPGENPEVIVDAEDAELLSSFQVLPGEREFIGELGLRVANAEIAGVRLHDIHPSRITFTGPGFEVVTTAMLGQARVDAMLNVTPLVGPPEVNVEAHLHRGTLNNLGQEILGAGKIQFIGDVEAHATMKVGGSLGPKHMAGTATVDVHDAGFERPEAKRAVVVLAVTLAPFLHFDSDGNVVVGDFHGGVSFTERGVNFDTLTYEAPFSTGDLRGYVRSTGLSAKLHFRPRKGSGAIEWGFVLRGELSHPKIALAVPAQLNAWEPCEDPTDCAIRGGAPNPSREDLDDERTLRELEHEKRRAAARTQRQERRARKRTKRDEETPSASPSR